MRWVTNRMLKNGRVRPHLRMKNSCTFNVSFFLHFYFRRCTNLPFTGILLKNFEFLVQNWSNVESSDIEKRSTFHRRAIRRLDISAGARGESVGLPGFLRGGRARVLYAGKVAWIIRRHREQSSVHETVAKITYPNAAFLFYAFSNEHVRNKRSQGAWLFFLPRQRSVRVRNSPSVLPRRSYISRLENRDDPRELEEERWEKY